MRGRHAVALLDAGRVVDHHIGDAFFRVHHVREFGDQLAGVFVARHQQRLVACHLATRRDRAQDVVAFPARHLHHRDVHGVQQALCQRELYTQLVVHVRALRLVALHRLYAESRLARVESAHNAVRMRRVDELQQHGQKAEDGVGGSAVGRAHGILHGVVGAVHE